MRRKDREVTDFSAILSIIDECDIIRIGLSDGEYPYIIPVNFAYAVENGNIMFFIHGAMAGRKYELMKRNKLCSFEMDVPITIECIPEKKDVTMRYKSVMGKATISFLEGEEKERAVDSIIMNRYEITRDFVYNKSTLNRTAVARLTVTEISAKANLVPGNAD
jgi:nitroimidazol reductase NimA-like FMN-containing flavoprotein (pyridoxamine 5'-phosphate oxidase superfamily)